MNDSLPSGTDREMVSVVTEPVAPDRGDRLMAALAYLGILSHLMMLVSPGRLFVRRHQHLAAIIHATRIVLLASGLGVWWGFFVEGDRNERLTSLAIDVSLVVAAGIPMPATLTGDLLPWVLTPLVVTWIPSLVGFWLAATGRTADFHAFTHADWDDTRQQARWFSRTPDEERRMARLARQRHLERIQSSTRSYASERVRQERLENIQSDLDQLRAIRDHNDRLLAIGEISRRRYEESQRSLDADIAELERIQNSLARRATGATTQQIPERLRVSRTDRASEALVSTVAVVAPTGIPIFTYGQFQLDEVIVAGALSAFDSLSEEVFGSRVHKTQLAEGQVLYFVHGDHVLSLAIFDDEPSPRQIEQLKTMLRQFEQANHGYLERQQYEPEYLHQVEIPFKFTRPLG
jgi:hypothetical protein